MTDQNTTSQDDLLFYTHDLSQQDIFNDMDLTEILPLLNKCPLKLIKQDDMIIHAGESRHYLYLILSGCFRVHLPSDPVNPVLVLGPGQSIGEISIIDHQPASGNVIADVDSRVLIIEETLLWTLVKQSHALAYNMLVVIANRLRNGNMVIDKIKQRMNEYEYNSTVDSLTGLYNRRWLDSMLERVMHRCATNQQALSVLMIDIDFFKQFNDKHGHIAGDQALRVVSRTILHNLRPEDMVSRYGGEELFALLPGLDINEAATIAERLRKAINDAEILLDNETVLPSLTVSIGMAQMQENDTAEQLIHAADKAMYRAKRTGKNIIKS